MRELFKPLMKDKHFKKANSANGNHTDDTYDESYSDNILGETYKRKEPYRKPVKPFVLKSSDQQVTVYSSLVCSELEEPEIAWPCLNVLDCHSDKTSESDIDSADTVKSLPKHPFTEKTLLPKLNHTQH